MKERVIVLAEGGVGGNFICTLLKTLHVPSWFDNVKMPSHGSMDLIAGAGSLVYNYYMAERKDTVYPEREEAMDLIMYAFRNPETTYKPYLSEYEKQFHEIHTMHYQWQKNIYKFLSLTNTKIIFVRYDANDYKRIAVNKITKNFTSEANLSDEVSIGHKKRGYSDLLIWAGLSNSDLIDELGSLSQLDLASMSKSLIDTLIRAWEIYLDKRSVWCNPVPHKNMIVLNFNDIYFNKEIIMESLAEFAGLPINDTTRSIYDDYLANQPNIDLY
jgi:hypothetical protein